MLTTKTFALEETTIDKIHAAFCDNTLTCIELVQGYLDRIAAYDQSGPTLNSYATLNPAALTDAAALDDAFQKSGKLSGPLHGIPIAVKDQAETKGIPTSFGSIAIKGYVPKEDSTLVAKLKEAGAVILGKTPCPISPPPGSATRPLAGRPKILTIWLVIRAAPAPAPAPRLPPISPLSASARTPAARSACRRVSTIWSVFASRRV